jgi:Family of unknown function (DUF6498)
MSLRSKLSALPPLIGVVGTNAVPVLGYFGAGWSAELTMLVYLCENIVIALLAAIKVRLVAPREGKGQDGKVVRRGEMLGAFLLVAFAFTCGSGFFLLFFVFAVLEPQLDREQFIQGLTGIAVFQTFGFFYDVIAMRNSTRMPEAEKVLEHAVGRIFLLCLCVFTGAGLAFFVERWFVAPFVVLKSVVDIGATVTQWRSLLRARTQ